MILYSDRDDHYSQRVRIVLAEKDIAAEINEAKPEETPDDILSISPYHKLPILVDRELASSLSTRIGSLWYGLIERISSGVSSGLASFISAAMSFSARTILTL